MGKDERGGKGKGAERRGPPAFPLHPSHYTLDKAIYLSVCLFIRTISQKTDAARITKLKIHIFHENPLILGQKVVSQCHKSQNTGSLHSYECWLLLIGIIFIMQSCFFVEFAIIGDASLCLRSKMSYYARFRTSELVAINCFN